MSAKATRMQDLATEFSKKNFGGDIILIPPDIHSGRGDQPRCLDPNLGLPQLFSRGCATLLHPWVRSETMPIGGDQNFRGGQ